jgi:hypothetical protein
LPEDISLKVFEPIGHGTISARVHLNEQPDLSRGLSYEMNLPVRCLLNLPDDPAFQRETSISLSLIRLGLIGWSELPATSFAFPINPADGYVDGSIYFAEQHHYVDLIGMKFGSLHEDKIAANLEMIFNFYKISELPKLPQKFSVNWHVALELAV